MIAVAAALGVIYAGARTFSTGNGSAGSCCARGAHSANQEPVATTSIAAFAGENRDPESADWTTAFCGHKGYYAANVYEMRDGHVFAVWEGRRFEVVDETPFTQSGNARYYFADEATKVACTLTLSRLAPEVNREVVSLATAEGNVVGEERGQKLAQCPVTGRRFLVTADSPVMVVDGRRIYLNQPDGLNLAARQP